MEIIHKIDETFGEGFPVRLYEVDPQGIEDMAAHSHEYMQVWYVSCGSCTHIVEGKSYLLPVKSLLILPPYVKHSFKEASGDLLFIGCEFPLELVTQDNVLSARRGNHLMEFSYMEMFETAICNTRACYIPSLPCQVFIEEILREMLEEIRLEKRYYEVMLKANLLRFLAHLARDYAESLAPSKISLDYRHYIETALSYIDANYGKKMYTKDVAKIASMSESYFSHFFKNVTGCTFVEYLNRIRVERARELLQNSHLSVMEISSAVGFFDNAYFNRVFKKLTGMSPSSFRKQELQNNTK